MSPDTVLSVQHLCKHYPIVSKGLFKRRVFTLKACDDVSFDVKRGETLGIVGESGSGKTTLGRAILLARALLDGGRNAVALLAELGGEFALAADQQAGVVVLGIDQVDAGHAVDHQVIDLRHVAVQLQAQVVQHHMVFAALEILVEVLGRFFFALDAFAQQHQLARQPLFLFVIEGAGVLQILEQGDAFAFVVG